MTIREPVLTSSPRRSNPIIERNPTRKVGGRSLEHACLCAKVCDDLRGKETIVLDLTGITPIFDYFVITTGNSRRQMHAIADESDRILSGQGSKARSTEGYDSSGWIVQDYGDVVLHVLTSESRDHYDLERLWGDAPHVDWQAALTESASLS